VVHNRGDTFECFLLPAILFVASYACIRLIASVLTFVSFQVFSLVESALTVCATSSSDRVTNGVSHGHKNTRRSRSIDSL
jgi:hypothetical protein